MKRQYILAVFVAAWTAMAQGSDWPQLQHDAQHTGYTADCPEPPWEPAWQVSFAPETIAPATQVVTAGARTFVGTRAGKMRALDLSNGKIVWTWEGAGPIMHTAAVEDGRLFFASAAGVRVGEDGKKQAVPGAVYALDALSGKLLWSFPAPKGFSTAPLAADGRVYIGGRNGQFHALDQHTGRQQWMFDAGAPILQTAAYVKPTNGRPALVVFGSEAIEVHALDAATGKPVWKSQQLYGESLKDYYPVVDGQRILVRAMSSAVGFASLEVSREKLQAAYAEGRYPEVPDAFQQQVREHLARKRFDQELFVLDAATGKECLTPLCVKGGTLDGPVAPPALDGRGHWVSTCYAKGACWTTVVRIDAQTGRLKDILWDPGQRGANSDENENFSVGGHIAFVVHPADISGGAGFSGAFDLDRPARLTYPRFRTRVTPALSTNTQAAGNAISISGPLFFHVDEASIVHAWRGQPAKGRQP